MEQKSVNIIKNIILSFNGVVLTIPVRDVYTEFPFVIPLIYLPFGQIEISFQSWAEQELEIEYTLDGEIIKPTKNYKEIKFYIDPLTKVEKIVVFEFGILEFFSVESYFIRALTRACIQGDIKSVQYLIEKNDKRPGLINYCNIGILLSCQYKHFELVKYLLRKGGNFSRCPKQQDWFLSYRSWKKWRRFAVRKWAIKLLPIFYHPVNVGGTMDKNEITKEFTIQNSQ